MCSIKSGQRNRGRVQFRKEVVLYRFLGFVQQETGKEIETESTIELTVRTIRILYGPYDCFSCTEIEESFCGVFGMIFARCPRRSYII